MKILTWIKHKKMRRVIPKHVFEALELDRGDSVFVAERLNDFKNQRVITTAQADYLFELYKE